MDRPASLGCIAHKLQPLGDEKPGFVAGLLAVEARMSFTSGFETLVTLTKRPVRGASLIAQPRR
jgi:hypothetical protein